MIFLGQQLDVFSPLAHADTERSPLGRMCYSHRIDIASRRSEGIKCGNFAIPIRDKEKLYDNRYVYVYMYMYKNKLL